MKLYVHLGLPRTATTLFQTDLFPVHHQINYLGRFPRAGIPDKSHLELTELILKLDDNSYDNQYIELLKKAEKIHIKANKTNIISDEFIIPYSIRNNQMTRTINRINSIFSKLNIDVDFFYLIRNQADIIKSYYIAVSPERGKSLPFNAKQMIEYIENKDDKSNRPEIENWLKTFKYWDLYKEFSSVVKKNNFRIFFYEKFKNQKNNFLSELSDYLQIDSSKTLDILQYKEAHTSISTLNEAREINAPISIILFKLRKNLINPRSLFNNLTKKIYRMIGLFYTAVFNYNYKEKKNFYKKKIDLIRQLNLISINRILFKKYYEQDILNLKSVYKLDPSYTITKTDLEIMNNTFVDGVFTGQKITLTREISKRLSKHLMQIKSGGITSLVKKFMTVVNISIQIPIYIMSIPAVILIRLIRPWFLIRWSEIRSSRIGHFSKDIELYCCLRDKLKNIPSQRYIDIFYLKKYVCNRQLEKMWRRTIKIYPTWLIDPLNKVNEFINLFVSGGKCHVINTEFSSQRDYWNIYNSSLEIKKNIPHISFTDEEELEGKRILTKLNIPENAKFVCLNVRDAAYLDRHKGTTLKDFSYHNYRDGDIDRYILAAEELTKRGYYVFRMGAIVLKPFKLSNPKIIDYPNSGIRSDFMDIYLGAKCTFCISNASGFDHIPTIFGKPVAYLFCPLSDVYDGIKNDLMLTKKHINNANKKELTISEIFSSNVFVARSTREFIINNIRLEENSPEEIRNLAIEMDERINGNWNETEEDVFLQKRMWNVIHDNINKIKKEKPMFKKSIELKEPLQGEVRGKFGAVFLRENKNWIK